MAKITWITSGAELVKRLRETGTGEEKLAIARKVLADAPDPMAVTAAEVIAALERDLPVGSATLQKARDLAELRDPSPELEDRVHARESAA